MKGKTAMCRTAGLVVGNMFFMLTIFAGVAMAVDTEDAGSPLDKIDIMAVRQAVEDMTATFGGDYPNGKKYIERLDDFQKEHASLRNAENETEIIRFAGRFEEFKNTVLLANPLLDFDRLLLIKRKPMGDARREKGTGRGLGEFIGLPRQSSWQQDTIPDIFEWDNEIAILSPVRPEGELKRVFKPETDQVVTDLELHYNGSRIMFATPGDNKCFQVFEMDLNGKGNAKQITPTNQPDVHNFDPFYLPSGKIGFISTACFQGVPCNASVNVAMTYLMDADGSNIRQLCFDQDHNYCPTVTNDGRILYLRWEYTDIPHVWGRYLFTMNPDGTAQREFYGSGEYWPNGMFYARPVPNHPTKVISIVTGHHVGRVGELVLLDPALGRMGSDGVIKRFGTKGRVDPVIEDKLTEFSWPKFLHPWPLSDKYFLVSAKPKPDSLWGIYLVDVFDNITLVKELEENVLVEPIPLVSREKPPVIVDRVDLTRKDALYYLEDIYKGPGLRDVPRGDVKQLRLFTYHFAYQRLAGISHRVGTDGPWEPKRVLGTVPVEEDGSAFFRVPANTPISMQPLDEDGRALALMRSWTTAMPGEIVSCVGCHEKQSAGALNNRTIAARKDPTEIEPWGKVRGFSFVREVQPVLDKYCVGCHDGSGNKPDFRLEQGKIAVLKNTDPKISYVSGEDKTELFKQYGGIFPPSYVELRRYIRVGGLESDIRLLNPGEFRYNTCELFQRLEKGHHGVKLDDDAWARLTLWLDLNGPCHGTWAEVAGMHKTVKDRQRRRALRSVYAGLEDDPEEIVNEIDEKIEFIKPVTPVKNINVDITCDNWPFDADEAKERQKLAGSLQERTVDLGGGMSMKFVLVPAGEFVMGDAKGQIDEVPLAKVTIAEPFWMGVCEVTNQQYNRFDPSHDSRYEHKGSWSFSEGHLGWLLNKPDQPVVRVSQSDVMAFCQWLSEKARLKISLPTEAQWEWACRAGSSDSLNYGDVDTDFGAYANMADVTIKDYAYDTDGRYTADIIPRDIRFDDGKLVSTRVGSYMPNAWGLFDMHGNVAEWTRSTYMPYPYSEADGRNRDGDALEKVVRGGSWYDRPSRSRSAFRLKYPAWQRVYNVGFRVVIESDQGLIADR